MKQPDSTAVTVALWRAAHLVLDQPPHVLEDSLGLKLAYRADVLRGAGFHVPSDAPLDAPGDGWLSDPRMDPTRRMGRGSVLARARFVEDLVVESGIEQYVILGAGLDSFALRRPGVVPRLQVFEVDEPDTQAWKRHRFDELGIPIPPHLHFAPVDFESGDSWVDKIMAVGFNSALPAIVAALGVTQYITRAATLETMRLAARLAEGTTFVCTFVVPQELIEPLDVEMQAATEAGAARRGHPYISRFVPNAFVALAREAGFSNVRHVSPSDLMQLYFAGRVDGLRAASSDHIIVATRGHA